MFKILLLVNVFLLGLSSAAFSIKYEKLTFLSSDSLQIDGKLWFPDSNRQSDKIVIAVAPCLNTSFPTDSSREERYDLYLRKRMIEEGMMYFEFTGRKDSVWKIDRKYPVSTTYTKAEDLENAIKYLRSREDVKNKKVFLMGMSEGGMTSAMVASRMNINGIILISTPAVRGEEFIKYQTLCKDTTFMGTFGTEDSIFDLINKLSSLKSHRYEKSFAGYLAFKKDMFGPLEEIMQQHDDYDTIAYYIMEHLKEKWNLEDSITRNLHKNFYGYCNVHYGNRYIQPEQIALYKWDPSLYYTKIKCPVISIFGDKDRSVYYQSSTANMRKMLLLAGNDRYTSIVLKAYDHYLNDKQGKIDKASLNKVIDWISIQ
jgi:alpha/beta superfamily hydrolase